MESRINRIIFTCFRFHGKLPVAQMKVCVHKDFVDLTSLDLKSTDYVQILDSYCCVSYKKICAHFDIWSGSSWWCQYNLLSCSMNNIGSRDEKSINGFSQINMSLNCHLKVSCQANMGFTTNLARSSYLSSMKTIMLLRICYWPNLCTFDSSRSSIFPFKKILMSTIRLQCSCFRELVISTHHHKKQ